MALHKPRGNGTPCHKTLLPSLVFKPLSADSSFWICEGEPCIVYLTSDVDDMLVLSENAEEHTLNVSDAILSKFAGKHEGRARVYNGMCIAWLDKSKRVLLTQAAHALRFVDQFSSVVDLYILRTHGGRN